MTDGRTDGRAAKKIGLFWQHARPPAPGAAGPLHCRVYRVVSVAQRLAVGLLTSSGHSIPGTGVIRHLGQLNLPSLGLR